jgi:hypothetical protein
MGSSFFAATLAAATIMIGAVAPTPGSSQAPANRVRLAATSAASAAPAPKPLGTKAPIATATPTPSGLTISVAIFRTPASGITTKSGVDPYQALAKGLNQLGPFHAWLADDASCTAASCRISDAQIYMYGQETASAAGSPATLVVTSFFVHIPSLQRIDNVTLSEDSSGATTTVPDFTTDDLRKLVGRVVLDDTFKLAIDIPDSDAALQLVPSPVNAADPDYEPILEHILETYGISSTRSHFAANALHGPTDPATCPSTQRYFVYRVRFDQYTRKLQGLTRLDAYAEGYIIDCTAPLAVPPAASGDAGHKIATTSALLTDLSALAVALFPLAQSRQLTLSTAAFSKLVDIDPTSTDVRDAVAAASLQRLADHMCTRLLEASLNRDVSSAATPTPTPTPTPDKSMHAPLVMRKAEPLVCKPRIFSAAASPNHPARKDNYEEIYSQWTHRPLPGAISP